MRERPAAPAHAGERVALVQLVNRVLDRGVVLTGDVTISVADVDLLYLGVRLLLASTDRVGSPASAHGGAHRDPPEPRAKRAGEGA